MTHNNQSDDRKARELALNLATHRPNAMAGTDAVLTEAEKFYGFLTGSDKAAAQG